MTPPIEGYTICAACGDAWVLREVATRTGGVCSGCFADGAVVTRIRVIADGVAMTMPTRELHRRRRNRGTPETRHKAEHARRRAKTRLAHLMPGLYDLLLAEERARLGLEPWPVEIAARGGDSSKTLAALEAYHAATNGVT